MSGTDAPQSETPQEELKGTLLNWGKIQLADHLRLMADNQQVLDQANQADAQSRELAHRVEEARAKAAVPELAEGPPATPAKEDAVNIYIDSPVSINQAQQETPSLGATSEAGTGMATGPAMPAAETPLWKKAAMLAAIVAATGGGGAGLATYLMQPADDPPAVVEPVEFPVPPGYGVEVEKLR